MADPIEILLIDANAQNAKVIAEAFKQDNAVNNLNLVGDGAMALAYLRREGMYSKTARPHLILLDLSLPKKSGRELLAEIKQDPKLRGIPVVVFTGSQSQEDIVRSYSLHASCFIPKPDDLHAFIRTVRSISYFWLNIVRLPPSV